MSQKQVIAAALRTARAHGGKVHKGAIHSSVAGRTDHLPMHVASGSYVIPADIISALGEGNSMAGFKVAKHIFSRHTRDITKGTPYGESGLPYSKAEGGSLSDAVSAFKTPEAAKALIETVLNRAMHRDTRKGAKNPVFGPVLDTLLPYSKADGGGAGENPVMDAMFKKIFSRMPDYVKEAPFFKQGFKDKGITSGASTSGPATAAGSLPYSTVPHKGGGGGADSGQAANRSSGSTKGGGGGGGGADMGQAANRTPVSRPDGGGSNAPVRETNGNNGGNNGGNNNSRPQPRPATAAPAKADRYTNAWDMINGGGKGAGYKNLGDMFDGGGMGAKGDRPSFGDVLTGKTNGYNSWLDRVNGGGKGGSLFNPAPSGVAAPAAGTAAAPEGTKPSWLNRNAGLVGAGLGIITGLGPIVGAGIGNTFKKDDEGKSKITNFLGMANGGATDGIPIVAAGGEYVIPPEDVVHIGGGDLDHGHKVLDAFVKKMRQKTIKTLQNLPGPKKD